jgi:hypothetical protein
MGFSIFAAGSGGYRARERHRVDFGDVYELADALSAASSPPGSVREWAEGEVVDQVTPSSGLRETLDMGGRILGTHMLNEGLTYCLAMRAPLNVFVSARMPNMIFPDSGGNWSGDFGGGEASATARFLRGVTPLLAATEMQNFNVLTEMGNIFSEYAGWSIRGNPREYRLMIHLRHD